MELNCIVLLALKAKQSKESLDECIGRSLYALKITWNIICTKYMPTLSI